MGKDNKLLNILKPVVRALSCVSILAGIGAIIVLVMFNFADVFTIITDEGTKYAEGFSYPGFQAIYSGYGNMIIQGYTETTFNFWMFFGNVFPILACLVATIILATNFLRRGTNKKKAIVEGIAAVLLIVGGIIMFNCDKLWIANAKAVTGSYTYYYEVYLIPALNGELYFAKDTFPSVALVFCLVAGIVKAINCGALLFQKYYARSVNKQGFEINESK